MKVQLRSTKSGMKSQSLKRLAVALTNHLGYKVFRTIKVFPKRKQFVYGASVNKLQQYQWFKGQGLSALEFTTDPNTAASWMADGCTVFGRTLLTASCGKGIVVLEPGNFPPTHNTNIPVFTKYKKKKREFRVHVFKNTVVNIVEKKLRNGWEKGPSLVRNLANGYVFVQSADISDELRVRIRQLALAASKVSPSDFRGVDLGYNEKLDDLFVIEVNSMPGIEGTNVDKYVTEILKNV